jgi:hypothetical protein
MPAASWPSTIGIGRGLTPSMTDKSEWHSPAAVTCTSISPSPGGASSSSRICKGRDRAYGRGKPISVSTAARVFKLNLQQTKVLWFFLSRKNFFFEKKKQKTFAIWPVAAVPIFPEPRA